MKRIIMHWTAGTHNVSTVDTKHYHEIVDSSGERHPGDLKPEANNSTADGVYAAHTRRLNTGSIGLAMACMHGAKERPFDAGKYPMKQAQLDAFVDMVAEYAETYNIPVTRKTILSHAEVQETLGVAQRGKWDIMWLPGWSKPRPAVETGDAIRELVLQRMVPKPKSLFAILKALFAAFRK